MPNQIRFLLRFSKKGFARFLSHRELLNGIEQALRRSLIPISFSEGFNPRPRISFPTALPLGMPSADEIMFIQLAEWMNPNDITRKINAKLTEDIRIISSEPAHQDKTTGSIKSGFKVEYLIKPLTQEAQKNLSKITNEKITLWLKQSIQNIQRTYLNKANKTINVRPYVDSIKISENTIFLVIIITNEGTARPDEVLFSLGVSGDLKSDYFIQKTKTLI